MIFFFSFTESQASVLSMTPSRSEQTNSRTGGREGGRDLSLGLCSIGDFMCHFRGCTEREGPWLLTARLPGRHMWPKMNLEEVAACTFNHGKAAVQ